MNADRVKELRALAEKARRPRRDVAYDGNPLLHVASEEDEHGYLSIYYGDGDGCAEVYGHLAFGIEASDMADLFAAAPTAIPDLLDALEAAQRERDEERRYRGVVFAELVKGQTTAAPHDDEPYVTGSTELVHEIIARAEKAEAEAARLREALVKIHEMNVDPEITTMQSAEAIYALATHALAPAPAAKGENA